MEINTLNMFDRRSIAKVATDREAHLLHDMTSKVGLFAIYASTLAVEKGHYNLHQHHHQHQHLISLPIY